MVKEKNIYEELSEERKLLQQQGELPEWFTTGSWQLFKEKVLYESVGYRGHIKRISKDLAQYAPKFLPKTHPLYKNITAQYGKTWEECFYNIMWQGHLAPSSPLIANGGTDRACTVSCAGSVIPDSVKSFYDLQVETALLSKEGFGTSSYLGGIRGRGSLIQGGKAGLASGTMNVLNDFVQLSKDITQGSVRRGAWAGYIEIDHDDFDEWADTVHKNHAGINIGWIFNDKVIQKLKDKDPEMTRRFKKILWVKMQTGKGYLWKVDHVNRQQPPMYAEHGLSNKASNLCSEIVLHSDEDHTYTCVLSSMNAYHFDEWKDSGAVFIATVLLDCNVSAFLKRARTIEGMERAVRFTEKSRALGLGVLGFHSYLQKNMVAIEDFEAHTINMKIFKHLDDESTMASVYLADELGEPEWCKGHGVRNTHNCAIAPNMSSATICGQRSQGIEPMVANAFLQPSPSGDLQRINPIFLEIAKDRNKFTKKLIKGIIDKEGSVQHLDWLSDHEKMVFKTAFEIDQRVLLRLASSRQQFIDQGQSLNLFFAADESEAYIAEIHKEFLLDERLKGLYYVRTLAGVQAAKNECQACEG